MGHAFVPGWWLTPEHEARAHALKVYYRRVNSEPAMEVCPHCDSLTIKRRGECPNCRKEKHGEKLCPDPADHLE